MGKKKLEVYTLDELLDKYIGKKETKERKKFESTVAKLVKKIKNKKNDMVRNQIYWSFYL